LRKAKEKVRLWSKGGIERKPGRDSIVEFTVAAKYQGKGAKLFILGLIL